MQQVMSFRQETCPSWLSASLFPIYSSLIECSPLRIVREAIIYGHYAEIIKICLPSKRRVYVNFALTG